MKRLMTLLVGLIVLAGCSSNPTTSSREAERYPGLDLPSYTETFATGSTLSYGAYDGDELMVAQVTVHGYLWAPAGPYASEEPGWDLMAKSGAFLILDVEYTSPDEISLSWIDFEWTNETGEVTSYASLPDTDFIQPPLPAQPGRGYLVFDVPQEAGLVQLSNHRGTYFGAWEIPESAGGIPSLELPATTDL